MSDYTWNRTGEIDEFARTLEQTLQCITPQPGTLELPPVLEHGLEVRWRMRLRRPWIGTTLVLVLVGLGVVLLVG